MTWTPPGPRDPRALADEQRYGQAADERYDRQLERNDRDAEHASLPPGHPALTDAARGLGRPDHRRLTHGRRRMHGRSYRIHLPTPPGGTQTPTTAELTAALRDGLRRGGFPAHADGATVTAAVRRPISHVRHRDGQTASGGYSVDEFMAAQRTLEDQAFAVLHELLAFGIRNDSQPRRIDLLSCNDRDELARQMHDWLDRHTRLAARLKLARPGAPPASAAA